MAADVWPKEMYHPGYPNGGANGLLVKDYRGKNAEQEIWKFDGGLVRRVAPGSRVRRADAAPSSISGRDATRLAAVVSASARLRR